MESISKKDISLRINNLKKRVSEINTRIEKNNEELDNRYNFAKELGIKIESYDINNKIIDELKSYLNKADEILTNINEKEFNEDEEYKILNNMLYLDDIKLKNINELIKENKDLKNKEYINKISDRANELIRKEEVRSLDYNINKLSNISFIDKITGKHKMKKALLENYNLKKIETINKKYVPENKSILEIVNITKNCGYKSEDIDDFLNKLTNKYDLGELTENSMIVIDNKKKIPFFFNKEFIQDLNKENTAMMDRINEKKKKKTKTSELEMYEDMLKKDVSSLELFNFNNVVEEVI